MFRYFDDLDALAAEAVRRQTERVRDVYEAPIATGDLDTRITAIVDQRLRIHRAVAVTSEAARRIEPRAESVARALAHRNRVLREQAAAQFAEELERQPAATRGELLDALDAALAFEQIDQLRRIAGHSPARIRALTRRTLHALLNH